MICALLLYVYGRQNVVDDVLNDYGSRRSHKGLGVTVPAQIHALRLFAECIVGPAKLQKPPYWFLDPFSSSRTPKFVCKSLELGPFPKKKYHLQTVQIRTFFGDIRTDFV